MKYLKFFAFLAAPLSLYHSAALAASPRVEQAASAIAQKIDEALFEAKPDVGSGASIRPTLLASIRELLVVPAELSRDEKLEHATKLEWFLRQPLPSVLKAQIHYVISQARNNVAVSENDPMLQLRAPWQEETGLETSNASLQQRADTAFMNAIQQATSTLTESEKLEFWSALATMADKRPTFMVYSPRAEMRLITGNELSHFVGFLSASALQMLDAMATPSAYAVIAQVTNSRIRSPDNSILGFEARDILESPANADAARAGLKQALQTLPNTDNYATRSLRAELTRLAKILDESKRHMPRESQREVREAMEVTEVVFKKILRQFGLPENSKPDTTIPLYSANRVLFHFEDNPKQDAKFAASMLKERLERVLQSENRLQTALKKGEKNHAIRMQTASLYFDLLRLSLTYNSVLKDGPKAYSSALRRLFKGPSEKAAEFQKELGIALEAQGVKLNLGTVHQPLLNAAAIVRALKEAGGCKGILGNSGKDEG